MAAIKKRYTVREARVIEEGGRRGWGVEKVWEARMVVRGEMEGEVRGLSKVCLGVETGGGG